MVAPICKARSHAGRRRDKASVGAPVCPIRLPLSAARGNRVTAERQSFHPDLYIRINGRQGAYVHQWRLRDSKTAVVEHFAVETEFVGKGFGLAIARGLASALRDEFETETIVFSERAYSEAHERFFKRLGAVPSDSSQYPGKPDWAWSLATAAAD